MKFTETWLKTIQPKASAYRIFEKGLIKGFGVQVTPKRIVSFFLCFQDEEGTTRYKTLGTHPALSLAEAREEALSLRKSVEVGDYARRMRKEGTLQHLCDYYLVELEKGGAKTTHEIRRVLYKEVLQVLGVDKLAKDVTPHDVRLVMHKCIERDAGPLANRVRSYLMASFKAGVRHDYDPRNLNTRVLFGLTGNPVDVVPRIGSFESVGERVLTLEEMRRVWRYEGLALSKLHMSALRLMILFGGLRPSEVTQAAVAEFNFDARLWNLPPIRSKNKKWHVIPLSDRATEVIMEMRSYNPNAAYLLPNKVRANAPECSTSLGHAIRRLVEELGMEDWTPRDVRRSCKTWMGHAGLSKEIRDRLQNHALTDVSSKHYDRYLYLTEKREALELWEQFIETQMA